MSTFDPAQRALEKQLSRDKDEQDLISGQKTWEDLRRENVKFIPPEHISFVGLPLPK